MLKVSSKERLSAVFDQITWDLCSNKEETAQNNNCFLGLQPIKREYPAFFLPVPWKPASTAASFRTYMSVKQTWLKNNLRLVLRVHLKRWGNFPVQQQMKGTYSTFTQGFHVGEALSYPNPPLPSNNMGGSWGGGSRAGKEQQIPEIWSNYWHTKNFNGWSGDSSVEQPEHRTHSRSDGANQHRLGSAKALGKGWKWVKFRKGSKYPHEGT